MASAVAAVPSRELLVRGCFVPTIVYVREEPGFHTRLCIYNYFSELFPDVTTGAVARLLFFDQGGDLIATREVHLPYRGQLQFDVSELGLVFEGTAGVALIPETMPRLKAAAVGTGYYVCYSDDAGHADCSHEWDAMRFEPSMSAPWLCVVRPAAFPDTELIVMNAYYGTDEQNGSTQWVARLRDGQGRVLTEKVMPPIPPRGCVRLPLGQIFPDAERLAREVGTVGFEAVGKNMQGPFTFVRAPNGDFNVHHFC